MTMNLRSGFVSYYTKTTARKHKANCWLAIQYTNGSTSTGILMSISYAYVFMRILTW
jgi:hypothetical protein